MSEKQLIIGYAVVFAAFLFFLIIVFPYAMDRQEHHARLMSELRMEQ